MSQPETILLIVAALGGLFVILAVFGLVAVSWMFLRHSVELTALATASEAQSLEPATSSAAAAAPIVTSPDDPTDPGGSPAPLGRELRPVPAFLRRSPANDATPPAAPPIPCAPCAALRRLLGLRPKTSR